MRDPRRSAESLRRMGTRGCILRGSVSVNDIGGHGRAAWLVPTSTEWPATATESRVEVAASQEASKCATLEGVCRT
jgi:hypothetical protein